MNFKNILSIWSYGKDVRNYPGLHIMISDDGILELKKIVSELEKAKFTSKVNISLVNPCLKNDWVCKVGDIMIYKSLKISYYKELSIKKAGFYFSGTEVNLYLNQKNSVYFFSSLVSNSFDTSFELDLNGNKQLITIW